jgi:hypothetical protein
MTHRHVSYPYDPETGAALARCLHGQGRWRCTVQLELGDIGAVGRLG